MIAICGADCGMCKDFKKTCEGCDVIKGRVYWAPYMSLEVCPMYDCCMNVKKLTHCGKCADLPCRLQFDTRDPSVSVEDHERGVRERAEILRKMP